MAGVFQVQDAIALAVRRAQLSAGSRADVDALAAAVRQVERRAPKVAMAAAATGGWVSAEQAIDADYWTKTLLKPAAAADLRGLLARSPIVLLTVGPQNADSHGAAVATLPTLRKRRADIESMFDTLAAAVAAGRRGQLAVAARPGTARSRAAAYVSLRARAVLDRSGAGAEGRRVSWKRQPCAPPLRTAGR